MISRRILLQSTASLALAPVLVCAQSDAFPTKPVTLVAPFTAGQTTDILARMVADGLSKQWGMGVTVDNKPGTGGAIGAQYVMRAPPDGYILLMGSSGSITIGPHLNLSAGYDPRKDFTPIMNVAEVGQVLVVPANSRFKTVQEFIAGAKAAPGKLNYGSNGSGSTQHLTMELLKERAGVDMQHIPYKGSPQAYVDLLGGRIDALFDGVSAAIPFAKSNQVRLLAVTTIKRDDTMPDVPTLAESGFPGFHVAGWIGVMAPAGLNPAIRNRINADLKKMLAVDGFGQGMRKLGMLPVGDNADDFTKFIASEYTRWGDLIKASGIKAE